MFERYTPPALNVLVLARHEAVESGSESIEPGHLLLGLTGPEGAMKGMLPIEDIAGLRSELQKTPVPEPPVHMALAHSSKRVLAYGSEFAEHFSETVIRPEHLLLGLLRENDPLASRWLAKHDITPERVRAKAAGEGEIFSDPSASSPPEARRNDFLNGRIASTHDEDGTTVIETHRLFRGHEIRLTERLKAGDDGRTIQYAQEIRGPDGKVHRFNLSFDV